MVLYGITLVPLVKDLRGVDPTLLSHFYADDVAFDGLVRRSAAQLCLLMDQVLDWRYFPEPAKSLFVFNNPEEKEAVRQEFDRVALHINNVDGSRYLGVYLEPRAELEA